MQLLFSIFGNIVDRLKKQNHYLCCLHISWNCYFQYKDSEVILYVFGIKLLFLIFKYLIVKLR